MWLVFKHFHSYLHSTGVRLDAQIKITRRQAKFQVTVRKLKRRSQRSGNDASPGRLDTVRNRWGSIEFRDSPVSVWWRRRRGDRRRSRTGGECIVDSHRESEVIWSNLKKWRTELEYTIHIKKGLMVLPRWESHVLLTRLYRVKGVFHNQVSPQSIQSKRSIPQSGLTSRVYRVKGVFHNQVSPQEYTE